MSIIEIRPDHGGKDAADFAEELASTVHKSLIKNGYLVSQDTFSQLDRSFSITTNAPVNKLQWLEGTHTIQRIPAGSSARHTSSATIVVREKVDKDVVTINMDDIRIDRYRGHGKGGQNRNKVSTAVRVVHMPTGIVITRESGRSQDANLESAMEQLKGELESRLRNKQKAMIDNSRQVLKDETKMFTHNTQRGEVVRHGTGQRWDLKTWNAGKISL